MTRRPSEDCLNTCRHAESEECYACFQREDERHPSGFEPARKPSRRPDGEGDSRRHRIGGKASQGFARVILDQKLKTARVYKDTPIL
mgnify:CR=1 FL=1